MGKGAAPKPRRSLSQACALLGEEGGLLELRAAWQRGAQAACKKPRAAPQLSVSPRATPTSMPFAGHMRGKEASDANPAKSTSEGFLKVLLHVDGSTGEAPWS